MSSGVYELKHECATTSVLITRTRTSTDILFSNKTQVPVSILTWQEYISNLQHFFWNAYIDRMSFGLAEGSTDLDPWWQPYFIVNKTWLVSFFEYRRKSRDRFRICNLLYIKLTGICVLYLTVYYIWLVFSVTYLVGIVNINCIGNRNLIHSFLLYSWTKRVDVGSHGNGCTPTGT